jgi:N6-adenosine-specific RNA methylase IME4
MSPFGDLPRGHYGAILADPPWRFEAWSEFKELKNGDKTRAVERYYDVMTTRKICALAVDDLAASDCVLFLWACWPQLPDALAVIDAWGFKFKTAAFVWTKAHAGQLELFEQALPAQVGMGYWTRANSEPCLLATRGRPKRISADVRQAIIEPRREHSRKPDGIHERIERLVAGPYLELFARQQRPGWDVWGNETEKFKPIAMPDSAQESWAEMWSRPFDFSQEPTS